MNLKNKPYFYIILIPLLIIIGMILKPICIYTFGETISLKVGEGYYETDESIPYYALLDFKDDYDYEKYYYLDILAQDSYSNKFDKTIKESYKDYIEKGESYHDDDYDSERKMAYAVFSKNNNYHDIQYITLNKPQNGELYIECVLSFESYSYDDYDEYSNVDIDINYAVDNKEGNELINGQIRKYQAYVDFDKFANLYDYYHKNDLKFYDNGDIVVNFKVFNSSILKV